jgi:monoamine oxidase
MSADILDVAIIGGGVSGCYAGYRLLTVDPPPPPLQEMLRASGRDSLSVAIYEASDRIGGRLWSYRFPELPNQVAEMGGMCFSPLHANVFGLCTKELALDAEKADEFSVYNLQYLRNHRFAFADFAPTDRPEGYYPGTVPYFLEEKEKWRLPTNVMLSAFKEAAPEAAALLDELANTSEKDIDKIIEIIGRLDVVLRNARLAGTDLTLPDYGFWNLLSEHASEEAYEMATMSSGFYSTTQNWNSYNTMLGCFVDFSVEQKWTKLTKGYDALPRELARRFAERGGKVHTKTRLCGLKIEGQGSEAIVTMKLTTPAGSSSIQRARNVILAIPPRAVRLMNPDTFLFRESQFVDDLSTVTCEPASKLFLTFAEAWWKKVPASPRQGKATIQSGQSATDLPMRLCYYLGCEGDGKALLLASFNDSIAVEYWNGFLPQSRFGLADAAWGDSDAHSSTLLREPPPAMLRDAVRQLSALHNFDVPQPLAGAFVNWSADPYGGAFHFWNTHVRSWEVMPRIRRPIEGVNVFLCGEAFSAKQGWVEGAINTAEKTLECYFGLPRPTWAPKDYEFGP